MSSSPRRMSLGCLTRADGTARLSRNVSYFQYAWGNIMGERRSHIGPKYYAFYCQVLMLGNVALRNLTFVGPCIARIFQYISNKMQRYTVYFIWKLLYMFRVLPPPIIRSANNCIYSIWYLSHRYCYLPL